MLNRKLLKVRQQLGIIPKGVRCPIVPIGTNPFNRVVQRKKFIIGHMGMLKTGQGLDLLFKCLPKLLILYPRLKIEIIGSGPDESRFRKLSKKFSKHFRFYGYVQDDDKVDRLIRRWSIGIATYMPIPSSEHYWTDPSKIKAYLNQAVPVITTKVPEFAKEVAISGSGIVINYNKPDQFVDAVRLLYRKNRSFSRSALILARKYEYHKLYKDLLPI